MALDQWQAFFRTVKKNTSTVPGEKAAGQAPLNPVRVAAAKMGALSQALRFASTGYVGRSALDVAASVLRGIAQWETPEHIAQLSNREEISDSEVLTICRLVADELDMRCVACRLLADELDERAALHHRFLAPRAYQVFVSWAHSIAKEYALELSKELQGEGYETFFSRWHLPQNADPELVRRECAASIRECECMVLVVTRGAVNSPWVKWEVSEFLKNRHGAGRLFAVYFDEFFVWEGRPRGRRLKTIFSRYRPAADRLLLLALHRNPRVFFVREFGSATTIDPQSPRAAFQILQCLANDPPEYRTERYELHEDSRLAEARADRFRLGCIMLILLVVAFFLLRTRL